MAWLRGARTTTFLSTSANSKRSLWTSGSRGMGALPEYPAMDYKLFLLTGHQAPERSPLHMLGLYSILYIFCLLLF